jgi:hypothetical protein
MSKRVLTRHFMCSFFAQFAFSSVSCTLIPTIPIYLSKIGSTEAESGVLVGIISVSSLILRPFVGRGFLNIPKRGLMMAGAFPYAISSIVYLSAFVINFLYFYFSIRKKGGGRYANL